MKTAKDISLEDENNKFGYLVKNLIIAPIARSYGIFIFTSSIFGIINSTIDLSFYSNILFSLLIVFFIFRRKIESICDKELNNNALRALNTKNYFKGLHIVFYSLCALYFILQYVLPINDLAIQLSAIASAISYETIRLIEDLKSAKK
jgi:Na+/H+ antiporter NhaD/arsenite permease-like protein